MKIYNSNYHSKTILLLSFSWLTPPLYAVITKTFFTNPSMELTLYKLSGIKDNPTFLELVQGNDFLQAKNFQIAWLKERSLFEEKDVGMIEDMPFAHLATFYSPMLKQLFEKDNALIDSLNQEFETPLHIAVIIGNMAAVKFLLSKNANPNQPDSQGYTPLVRAIELAKPKTTELLLNSKANPNQTNEIWERSPLDYALGSFKRNPQSRQEKLRKIVKLLVAREAKFNKLKDDTSHQETLRQIIAEENKNPDKYEIGEEPLRTFPDTSSSSYCTIL